MTSSELASRIDLTLLRPDCAGKDVEALARRAKAHPFAALCVPPCHVRAASRELEGSSVKVCTVIGFPLGFSTAASKVFEAKDAFENGALELDMVMNVSAFRSGEFALVEDEISEAVSAVSGALVKVIIETCYLTEVEKKAALNLAVRAGAHFVKTSTGFGPAGANVNDVRLLSEWSAGRIGIKASGGIKGLKAALAMIDAGAGRIGTSSGIEIIEELTAKALHEQGQGG